MLFHLLHIAANFRSERNGLRGLEIGSRSSKCIGTSIRTRIVNGAPKERARNMSIARSSQAANDFLKLPIKSNDGLHGYQDVQLLLTLKAYSRPQQWRRDSNRTPASANMRHIERRSVLLYPTLLSMLPYIVLEDGASKFFDW